MTSRKREGLPASRRPCLMKGLKTGPQNRLQKKETIPAISSAKDDPGVVASKAFYEAVFQGHPYGIPVEGDEESVNRITRDDILNYYQQYYKPNNTIIAVTGDID